MRGGYNHPGVNMNSETELVVDEENGAKSTEGCTERAYLELLGLVSKDTQGYGFFSGPDAGVYWLWQ